MKRNLEKSIEYGRKNTTEKEEITAGELLKLLAKNDTFETLTGAFYLGVAAGIRAKKNKKSIAGKQDQKQQKACCR